LTSYFIARYARNAGKVFGEIENHTLDLFQSYNWPGNIRELQNVIERSVILSPGGTFSVDEVWLSAESDPTVSAGLPSGLLQQESLDERSIIEAALRESRGRVSGPTGAAAKLKVPSTTLESRIKALNIQKSRFKFAGHR
jgi:DNA-binding NtrC family response regulator